MDTVVAESIINEVKTRGLFAIEMPTSDDEKVLKAEEILSNAKEALPTVGKKSDTYATCQAIIAIAEMSNGSLESPLDPKGGLDGDSGEGTPEGDVETKQVTSVTIELESGEHMPVPPEIESVIDPLPIHINDLSDGELRRKYSESHALSSRLKWLVSVESGKLKNAKRLLEHERRRARKETAKTYETGEGTKVRLAADIENDVESDAKVAEWRRRVEDHEDTFEDLKTLRDIRQDDCERISREWTFRSDEFQRAGGLPGRRG